VRGHCGPARQQARIAGLNPVGPAKLPTLNQSKI